MPLLHKKPIKLEPIPNDLRPDEEVFICHPTQEIFRDYETFFNRMFQCNSQIWTCAFTGMSGLTYAQALESEREATKMMDGLADCYKKAALELIHHAPRTNMKTLADEICLYYRDRFVEGEVVDMTLITSSGAKILKPVQVVRVVLPSSPTNSVSPIKVPVISSSANVSSPPTVLRSSSSSPSVKVTHEKTTNGLVLPLSSGVDVSAVTLPKQSMSDSQLKSPHAQLKGASPQLKSPPPSKVPISPYARFEPSHFKYLVKLMQNSEVQQTTKASALSRPKGVLTPKKLRVFLRNAIYRLNEKQPFVVKEEYVAKYDLKVSSIDFASYTHTPRSGKKRSLSQSKLEGFVSPSSSTSVCLLSESFLTGSSGKKPRPFTLVSNKSTKKKKKKRLSQSSRTVTPTSKKKNKRLSKGGKTSATPKKPSTPKTPTKNKIHNNFTAPPENTPKSPPMKAEALKILQKAKRFKQMDLKKSVVKKSKLSAAELQVLRALEEQDRQRRAALAVEEKRKRKETRMKYLQEKQEQRRLEKLKQLEWLKPREDLECEDSKPLPEAAPVKTSLSHDQFGEAVMVLEFLNAFGPLFGIKDVISGGITFEKIEYAVTSQEMDSLLFEVVKFLLQAIFATMEEEHEDCMVPIKKNKAGRNSSPVTMETNSSKRRSKESTPVDEGKRDRSLTPVAGTKNGGESQGEEMEQEERGSRGGERDDEVVTPVIAIEDDIEEDAKPLDVRVQSIKCGAVAHSQWSFITQHLPLHNLVIDAYTCSEVLRLHVLSCGGFRNSGERNCFRHYRRGGYTDADDPSMALRLNRPNICTALTNQSIFMMSPADKLVVLSTLCSQLLTYTVTREFMDDTYIKAKKARIVMRSVHFTEERRKKEEKKAQIKKQQQLGKEKEGSKEEGIKKTEDEKSKKNEAKEGSGQGVVGDEGPQDAPKMERIETEDEKSKKKNEAEEGSDHGVVGDEGPKDAPTMDDEKSSRPSPPPPSSSPAVADGGEEEKEKVSVTEEELEELNRVHQEKVKEEIACYRKEAREASMTVNIQPIGTDRYHRKYWVFPSLPGLFMEVDENAVACTDCEVLLPPPPQPQPPQPHTTEFSSVGSLQGHSSHSLAGATDGETRGNVDPVEGSGTSSRGNEACFQEAQGGDTPMNCVPSLDSAACSSEDAAASSTPSIALQPSSSSQQQATPPPIPPLPQSHEQSTTTWYCYSTKEEVDTLLESLNPRGLREKALKKTIDLLREERFSGFSGCVFTRERTTPDSGPKHKSTTEEFFELYLREQILDIEEKIHIGNLGQVGDRLKWRNSIENSGAAASIGQESSSLNKEEKALGSSDIVGSEGRGNGGIEDSGGDCSEGGGCGGSDHVVSDLPAIQELSGALLQVHAGIGTKFLMPPLGRAVPSKKKEKKKNEEVKDSDMCLEEWRSSLSKATSFSQIFLHLATLERAVMWSKSLMKVRCRICRRQFGEECMLLCDGCDHGYHTYCLKPPLQDVPEGDWFCYDCIPVTPIKPRRRTRKLMIVEEVEEEEEEEEEMEEKDEEQESDSNNSLEVEEEEEDDEVVEDSEGKENGSRVTRAQARANSVGKKRSGGGWHGKRGRGRTQSRNRRTVEDVDEEEDLIPPSKKGRVSRQARGGRGGGGRRRGSESRNRRIVEDVEIEEVDLTPPSKRGRVSRQARGGRGGRKRDSGKQKVSHHSPEPILHSRKKLQLDPPSLQHQQSSLLCSKAEAAIASIIEVRSSNAGRKHTGSLLRELRGLENQLCLALWDEVSRHKDSWHFATPFKKKNKQQPSYLDDVPFPMDLKTIKGRIKRGGYSTIDEFLRDMSLIFSSSAKYYKHLPNIKKAGVNLKRHFEKLCSNLGLWDLQLSQQDWTDRSSATTTTAARRHSSRLNKNGL